MTQQNFELVTPAGHSIVLQSLKQEAAQVAPALESAALSAEEVSCGLEDEPDLVISAESSLKAQTILQQLICAVQSQEAEAQSPEAAVYSPEAQVQSPEAEAKSTLTALSPLKVNAVTPAPAPLGMGKERAFATPELSAAELERYNRMQLKSGDLCPTCGQGTLVLRQSGKVAFLGCSHFPSCKLRYFTRTISPVHTLKLLVSKCPQCGAPLAVKKGRYGLFVGCSNYPNCSYSPKEADKEQAVACPICHEGMLRPRRSSAGKVFYGCDCFPKCDFKLMGAPYLKSCPECGFNLRFKKRVKVGIALVCANPKCATRKKRKYDLLSEQECH